jgi:uncharacterized membrane protein YjfL (UPF0719 family)
MSEDETMVLIVALIMAVITWFKWYRMVSVKTLIIRNASRFIFVALPVICVALLYLILRKYAADDVRDSGIYLLFYMALGVAWVGLSSTACSFIGICPRDDVVERQNMAAAFATTGALLGITLCFGGGNIGNGPGWWVVIFSGLLSTATFFALWGMFEYFTNISESVTVERDSGAGLRLGGLLCGMGLILGRAVAGDWVSTGATVMDFMAVGWVALPLAGAAAVIERLMPRGSNGETPVAITGLFIGGLYTVGPALYVFFWQEIP